MSYIRHNKYFEGFDKSPIPVSNIIKVKIATICTIESWGFLAIFQYLTSKIISRSLLDFAKLNLCLYFILKIIKNNSINRLTSQTTNKNPRINFLIKIDINKLAITKVKISFSLID